MGAKTSTLQNSTDILIDRITKITTNVLNTNQVSSSAYQSINVETDPEVLKSAAQECQKMKSDYETNYIKLAQINPNLASTMSLKFNPESYSVCTIGNVSNINQSQVISINLDDNSINNVSNSIKDEIISTIQKEINASEGGTIGYSNTDINNLTTIKNVIRNNFDTSVINQTIRIFSNSQNISGRNVSIMNINQSIVSNAIASNVVNNLINSSQEFKTALSELNTSKYKSTSLITDAGDALSNIIKSATGFYIIFIIIFIICTIISIKLGFCFLPFICNNSIKHKRRNRYNILHKVNPLARPNEFFQTTSV